MRLSEAMMLGDGLRKRDASIFLSNTKGVYCGCAIGGAVLAAGAADLVRNAGDVCLDVWPWLGEISPDGTIWRADIGVDWEHGFDAVMRNIITFEQLVDYVRSIEPACGECNRFECACVAAKIESQAEVKA